MSIPTYTPGYPPDGSSLGQTKSTIRNNLDGTFLTLGIDHVNNNGEPGSNPAGYHNVIHVVPQGSNPPVVSGFGQIFSKTISSVISDQALFWETGSGIIQQLTMNVTPVSSNNGYSFLPGGVLVQWGIVSNPGTSGTVTFISAGNINFPNNLVNVQLSLRRDSGNQSVTIDSTKPFNGSQFSYLTSSSGSASLYWFAIGN